MKLEENYFFEDENEYEKKHSAAVEMQYKLRKYL